MAKLRPRARIIRTVGDQLISGPEAALIELVKNSYDADSPFVLIRIVPRNPEDSGLIEVSDEGHGMSEEDILTKWLEPATDEKLQRRASPNGRPMLGAKGIGRFAASKLGRYTILESVCEVEGCKSLTQLRIDWDIFDSKTYLEDIDIPVESSELPTGDGRKPGVHLQISDLRDVWTRKRLETLIRELRRVASPTDRWMAAFRIRLDLTAFDEKRHGFNGQELLTGLNVGPDEQNDPFLIRPFSLQKHSDYSLSGSFDNDGAFRGEFVVGRGDNVKQKLLVEAPALTEEEESCGPFSIRLNIYDREKEAVEALFGRMGVNFDKVGIQAARRILSENAGISIFRKGFRIRPYGDSENDWLELERQRVQDPSRKLGLSQVSGTVEIGDETTSHLIERSSREGLEHGGAFERLKRLIHAVVVHVEERRFQFREKAGLSRRVKGSLQKVRETAALNQIARAVRSIPVEYRGAIEAAIQKNAAALATELEEIDEFQAALQSRSALGLVVAEVVHEGRRVLNPVASSAKTLVDGSGWVLEKSARGEVFRKQFSDNASSIHDGVRQLSRLFKKLDPISGRRRGRPRQFKIREIVDRSISLFKDQIEVNKIRMVVEIDAEISAYGYEEDFQAALMNIVDNAIHWLSILRGKRTLEIHANKRGKFATVRITNNGPSIDETYIDRLFDAGFTLKTGGTGLGLAIAREALRRSKGELSYDDGAPETTFVIRMPAESTN